MKMHLELTKLSSKKLFLLSGLLAGLMVAGSFYFQFVEKMQPCPLCIFQRFTVILLGILFLIPGLISFKPIGNRIFAFIQLFVSGLGLYLAGKHVWLQSLPPEEVPVCSYSFNYMMEHLPWREIVTTVLQGTGECAKISWKFGLTLPGWVLVFFVGTTLVSLWTLFRRQ